MLTQLTNLISSRTGRVIHVSSDDFNATDGLDNRGNSPLRPFKSIQRALLEIARYSYVPGFNNDRFSQFSIQLSPGVYFIDNRPGLSSEDEIVPFGFDANTKEWEKDTIVDLGNRDNIYWKYNTTEGGCILPRGSSIVSYDLRHTIIKPLYVPDPVDEGTPRTALFNTTGECYFFGFTIRDAEVNENSPLYDNLSNTGKVYYDRNNYGLLKTPLYSHHKITVFVFASDVELDLYYKKVGKAFSKFQPTIANEGEFDERIEESRIVGPLSDFRSIQSIVLEQTIGVESSTDVIVNLTTSHNYFEGQFIAISNTGIDDLIEGVFQVTSISADNTRQFKYRVPYASTAIGVGYALDPLNPTVIDFNSQPVALDSSASASAEIDTTESASPYVLNCTLRSDWGMCGMWADGLRTSGFKSMVVAQFTGISLQKDDRSFIRYNDSNNTWRQASLSSAFSPDVEHTKGDSYWKTDWRTFHIRASEGAFIQCVSVFAIGEGDHFLMESGGDMSITNSNSNFGDTALHAKGFRGDSFVKDSGGYISHIIPPQELDESLENQSRVSYYTIDIQSTIADSENENKLFIGGDDNIDPYKRPAANVKGQRIGNKQKEKLFVRLDPEVVGGTEVFDAEVVPNGFLKYIARPSNTVAVGAVSGVAAKALDAANLIEANRRLIQEESFGWMLEKYPELRSSKKVFPDRSDFPTEGERGKLFDAVSLIIKNKRFIQDETLKYILGEFPSLKNTKLFPTDTDQEITPEERRSSACFRDIGFFLDSLTSDLRRGGNKEIVSFANIYKDETGIVHVANEITETKTAFSYAANMAIAAMRNFEFSIEGATVVGGTTPLDISYLNVGDNSGILVGMEISGDGIPSDMFVGKLVDNDKIIVKDSNDRLTGYVGDSPNTVTFSIKPDNMYFNELSPIIDETVIEDSPTTKCVEVAERIINLERNVIDLLSDKVIDIEEAEDNAITSPCYRDIGYFVDAIIGDLKSGGNLRSIKVGETYRSGNDINFIEGELEETISTYEYAKNVAIASMRNFNATMTRIETTNGSSTITVGDTSGLIVGMRVIDETNSIIPEDTVIKNVIDTEQVTLGRAGSTPTTGDEVVALSDNTAATLTFMSPEYLVWSDERISVDNSIIEDVQSPACTDIANRINMLSTDMINIIKGRTGVDVIPPIDLSEDNSQLGRGKYLDAANLIESNRELIKEEALGRIKSTNPSFEVPKEDLCKRDIGFLVDSLVSDLRIGGNLNTLRTGENYRDGNKILFIEDELEETIEAFEYVGNLSTMAMRNFNLSASVNLVNNSSQINVGSLGYELLDGMLIIGDGIPKDTYIKKNPTNQELVNLYDSKDFDAEYVYTGTGGTLQVTFELDASNALVYSEIVASVDPSVAVDGEMPPCADIATRIRGLIVDLVNVLDINSEVSEIIRVEPDSNVSGQTSRTTIFDIDVSGTGSSDAHNLQTGTPVRLVPRPKFNSSLGAYEDVDPRLVRLPKGFEPNKTYYVIAPGRKTQPYDYSNEADRSLFGQQQTTKLMLAETKESAIVGLYIYSPEGDSVDPNVEIDLYQFVSDESYDLERYKCIGVTGSTKINTNIGHNFDIPSTEENATKVFFRTILGSRITRLPEVSNILKRDFSVSLDGRIRDDVEFYVRPFGIKTFSVYKTLDDAVNDVAPIAFNYQDEEFNVFFNKKRSPLKYDASYGKWYLNVKRTSDFIIDRIKKSDYSGRLRTTDSWFTRIVDNRKPEDRIYRLRYVIPSYNINVSPPANGFVLKLRTDDFRGLLPQRALVRGKVNLLDKNANKITITQEDFDRFGFTEELRYDPYRKSSLGDTRVRINTDSNVIATVQSARFVKLGGLDYTEIILMDPEVDVSNSLLKNATFTTVEISQPQNGNGKFVPGNSVEWNNGVDSAIVQSYIENFNKHYLILRNVVGNLENDSSIVFKQDDVEAGIKGYPDFGRSLSIALKVEKDLDEYYYSKKNASVYTITPGDTFRDSSGNSFVIESVEDIGNIDNTYYIYTSDTIQEHIPNQQDGVYYLNVLKGDVSPFPTSAGVANNFKDYKFSQPIGSLYPIDFSNDPIWFKYAGTSQAERDYVRGLKDPLPTSSVADNFLHGLVTVNDTKRSATKEAILDLLDNDPFAGSSYVLEAQRGNALAGAEDRLIPIMGDDPYVSRSRLYIELRRYSIARAGNHTFEYLGYGPGNYSTALPIRQQQVKTPIEDFYSQSKKENGGVVFYTGSDSTGGFYIGNRRFDSITNEEEILESAAIVSDTESDSDIITDLVETFISPVTFNENITVLGGDGSDPSIFESPLVISVQAIDLTQIDYPLTIRSNVNSAIDDRLLDRTNFRPLISGDITIGKNTIRSASFELSPRAFGQGYSIRTHAINGSASNATPLPNTPNRLADFGINSPKSGDIVLRGKNIEEFGSVGWIYTNRLLDSVPLTEISEITFDPSFDRVSIYWTVPRRNDNQGVVNTAEVTFDGFDGDYSFMNGRWTVVESDRRYNGGEFSVSDTVVVLEGFNVPDVESLTVLGSVSIRISLANWKEVGVLGAEAIRTYTGELGEYRTGINTVARSNQDDYENGYVAPIVSPRFNLDVVGDALITGENIDYNSASLMADRDITNAENALIVGYSSNDVLSNNFVNSAGLRVSSKNPGGWKVGINVNYDIVDTGYDFIVNGPVQYRADKFQLTNNVVIGTSEATGEVSIFDKKINDNDVSIGEPFAGTITIGNDASVINISSSNADTANEVNIGRGDSLSETSSIVNIKSSSLNVYGNARFGANKDVEDKLTLSTAAGEVSIFDSIPSDITLGNVASRISIGSFVGDTIVNNRLKVSSEFEISGSITLFGGSDSSSYNVKRDNILGTYAISHVEGDFRDTNVDVIVLDETFVLELDYPGGGGWTIGTGEYPYTFFFKINTDREELGELEGSLYNDNIGDNIRVGDFLFIADGEQREILKVVDVTNLLGDSQNRKSIVIERNPLNVSGIALPSDPYKDVTTKVKKATVITSSSYLDIPMNEESSVVSLGTFTGSVKTGDYFLLSGVEFVEIESVASTQPRKFSVLEGLDGPSMLEVNTFEKIINIGTDTVNITGKELNIASSGMTFSIRDEILGSEDIFRVNSAERSISINAELFNVKVGSSASPILNIDSTTNMGRGSIVVNTGAVSITSDELSFNISKIAFTVPSAEGDVFTLINNPTREAKFNTDLFEVDTEVLDVTAEELNLRVVSPSDDPRINLPDLLNIDGDEKSITVNSDDTTLRSSMLRITGDNVLIDSANLDFTSRNLTLGFSAGSSEIFSIKSSNRTGKFDVNIFEFIAQDFDISGGELDITSDDVTVASKDLTVNVDPTGSNNIFSLVIDNPTNILDGPPTNLLKTDGVDYDIDDSDFNLQSTQLTINSDSSLIESTILDLKIGDPDSPIFTIDTTYNSNKGSVAFDVGKFAATAEALDLEGNPLTISGNNFNIDSESTTFSNKNFFVNIAPDPPLGESRKSIFNVVLDSNTDPETRSFMLDIYDFDVISTELTLDSMDMTLTGDLLSMESKSIFLDSEHLSIKVDPTGSRDIFVFDSNKLNIDNVPESVVKFDVDNFTIDADTLNVVNEITNINSSLSNINIRNLTFESALATIDIGKTVVDGVNESLFHVSTSLDLVKFQNANEIRLESLQTNLTSDAVNVTTKDVALDITPDTSKPKLLSVVGNDTDRTIELNPDEYNLTSTNSTYEITNLTSTLGDNEDGAVNISMYGADIKVLDNRNNNVLRFINKVDGESSLNSSIDRIDIVTDRFTTTGNTLTLQNDNVVFNGDLIDFQSGRIISDVESANIRIGGVRLDTAQNRLSANMGVIALESTVNLDIDAVSSQIDITAADIEIQELELNVFGKERGADLIKVDGVNYSIELNVDNLDINVNDGGTASIDRLAIGNTFNAGIDSINSRGTHIHIGSYETANNYTDSRTTYFSVDTTGKTFIQRSLSIGDASAAANEIFKVDLDGSKEFVIKNDGSIDAFGIEGYYTPNGGRRAISVNVGTNYPGDRLPTLNVVYFFNPSGLAGRGTKRFDLPSGARNGDFIVWITTGNLTNTARLILGGNGTSVMGDTEGVMFNVPYASCTLYFYNGGWWLSDLP